MCWKRAQEKGLDGQMDGKLLVIKRGQDGNSKTGEEMQRGRKEVS